MASKNFNQSPNMVIVGKTPQTGKWIGHCLRFKPLRIIECNNKCWLYFATPPEAFNFVTRTRENSFKAYPLTISAVPIATLEEFDKFARKVRRWAQKHQYEILYDIK